VSKEGKPVKATSGSGDSYSAQLLIEIASRYRLQQNSLPNVAIPTISQASYEPNAFHSDKYSEAFPLLRRVITNWLDTIIRLAVPKRDNPTKKLCLNIHTAFNRDPQKDGNPLVEIIIGTFHGITCDFDIEVKLAEYLKEKGFGVFMTSLVPLPDDSTDENEDELKAKKPIEGEPEATNKFFYQAKETNLTIYSFPRDENLEKLGRLRGTSILPWLRNQHDNRNNVIQLEIVRNLMSDDKRRQALAEALAQFCIQFENGKI